MSIVAARIELLWLVGEGTWGFLIEECPAAPVPEELYRPCEVRTWGGLCWFSFEWTAGAPLEDYFKKKSRVAPAVEAGCPLFVVLCTLSLL